jgi:hypothetical protein
MICERPHEILPVPYPCGLCSLRDMLDHWGYLYFATANALTYAETALEQQRARTGGTVAGHGTGILDPHGQEADLVHNQCREVLRMMQDYRDELGPIPFNLEVLTAKLFNSRKSHQLELYTNDVLDEVRKILNDFRVLLSIQKFYYLPPTLSRFYGQPILFGEAVAKKFRAPAMTLSGRVTASPWGKQRPVFCTSIALWKLRFAE